jgi:glycosyltransferase involved in cell wall biosynthesis
MSSSSSSIDILIGANSLQFQRAGIGRLTLEIAQAARAHPAINKVTLLMGHTLNPETLVDRILTDGPMSGPTGAPKPWKVAIARVPGIQILREIKLATGLRRRVSSLSRGGGKRLVYYEPNMVSVDLPVPTVPVINDLSWHFERSWHPAERLAWIDRNLPSTLQRARRFIAVSGFTRDAAVRELGIPLDHIDVVPNAPAAKFQPVSAAAAISVLARFGLVDRSYVLAISTLEPRKNFDRLLRAYLALKPALRQRVPLVVVGGKGWGEVLLSPAANAAVQDGSLRVLGYVDDLELLVLIGRASLFAYVSLYEGFGIPVVEAMASDTPVLCSSTTAVGETAGDAAMLVDPYNEQSIAEGMYQLLEDQTLATRLRVAGLKRAKEFSWIRSMNLLVESFHRALA